MDLLYHMHTDIADMGAILKMIVYSNMASTSSEAAEIGLQQPAEPGTSSQSYTPAPAQSAQSTTNSDNQSSEPAAATADGSAEATEAGSSERSSGGGSGDSTYECTICLETAKDAVVSLCGHLFCWPCLHQWLETRPQRPTCPVCKSAISKDKVIPLYGRDTKNQQDPRTKEAPPRPTAQRSEPETSAFHGFGFPDGGGFHMSFGIGAFPFGFFTSTFNFGSEPRPVPTEEDQFLSKFFLWIGILFLAWLILA